MDWSRRPPRSYAELEGFEIDEQVAPVTDVPSAPSRAAGKRTRALRLVEVGLFALLVLTALVVASANIVGALRDTGGGL